MWRKLWTERWVIHKTASDSLLYITVILDKEVWVYIWRVIHAAPLNSGSTAVTDMKF